MAKLAAAKPEMSEHRRHRFDPWVGKILWRREWQPTPVFLPGESHGQRSLDGYSPWGRETVRHDLVTTTTTTLGAQVPACHSSMCQYFLPV